MKNVIGIIFLLNCLAAGNAQTVQMANLPTPSLVLNINPDYQSTDEFLLTSGRAGLFHLEMNEKDWLALPGIQYSDTILIWENGKPDTVHSLVAKEKGTTLACLRYSQYSLPDGSTEKHINGIYAISPHYVTEKNVGVGFSVHTVRQKYPEAEFFYRHGKYYARLPENDIEFEFEHSAYFGPLISTATDFSLLKANLFSDFGKIIGVLIVQ